MTRLALVAALAGALATSALAADNDPTRPPRTLSKEVCDSLSDTYWRAMLDMATPCYSRWGCWERRALLQKIAHDAQQAWIDGNCGWYHGEPQL